MKNLPTRVLEASINGTIWVTDAELSGLLSVNTIIICLDEEDSKRSSSIDKTLVLPDVGLLANFSILAFNVFTLVKIYS